MSGTRNRITFKRFFGSILAAALLSGLIAPGAQISLRSISNGKFNLPWSELLPIAALSAAVLFIIMLIPANKPVRLLKNLGRVLAFVLALALVWGMGAAWIAQDFFMFPSVPADERAEQQLAADSRFDRVLLPSLRENTRAGYGRMRRIKAHCCSTLAAMARKQPMYCPSAATAIRTASLTATMY